MDIYYLVLVVLVAVLLVVQYLIYKMISKSKYNLKAVKLFYVLSIQMIYIPAIYAFIFLKIDNIISFCTLTLYNIAILLMAQLLKVKLLININEKKIQISSYGIFGARINFCIFGALFFGFITDFYKNTIFFIAIIVLGLILTIAFRKSIKAFFSNPNLDYKIVMGGLSVFIIFTILYGAITRLDPNSYNKEGIIQTDFPFWIKLIFLGLLIVLCILSIDKYSLFSRISTYFHKNNILYKNDSNNNPLQ